MNKFDHYDELILERKENTPEAKQISKGILIAKNSRGLYIDLNKTFEGFISANELGKKKLDEYQIGEKFDVFICANQNQDGVFRLSIKEIEKQASWGKLETLEGQNLELKITKIVKSGVEAEIIITGQTGFLPGRYIDSNQEVLRGKTQNEWVGINIPGRIHELDKEKSKIILNNRVISEEQRSAHAEETLKTLTVGQSIEGDVVRCTDFGVFVDIGGIDALIPASELSWRRFKKPSDILKPGDRTKAKIFRVDIENKKVGLSIKQEEPDPWTALPEEAKIGTEITGTVVTHAEFGAFLEVFPGVEALLHKSNIPDGVLPAIGSEVKAEITNIEPAKKRMGIALTVTGTKPEAVTEEAKAVEVKEENSLAETKPETVETSATVEAKEEIKTKEAPTENKGAEGNPESETKELEHAK